MSLFRYAVARVMAGLLSLGLFALFFTSLVVAQQTRQLSAALLAGPEPAPIALAALKGDTSPPEVKLLARIDKAIDVAVPAGMGRVYLLADPQAGAGAARAAIYVSPRDFPAFEALLPSITRGETDGAMIIELSGVPATPYWIDRIERAVTDSQRQLAPDAVFIRPFLHGREAGLAPSPLACLVPAIILGLLVALLTTEIAVIRTRRAACGEFPPVPAYA